MKKEYGFLEAEEPFERTYRTMSNLDDMHVSHINKLIGIRIDFLTLSLFLVLLHE